MGKVHVIFDNPSYGEHDNKENYHQTGLPRRHDLTDDHRRKDFEEIIDVYARNAQKFLTTGDSQAISSLEQSPQDKQLYMQWTLRLSHGFCSLPIQ